MFYVCLHYVESRGEPLKGKNIFQKQKKKRKTTLIYVPLSVDSNFSLIFLYLFSGSCFNDDILFENWGAFHYLFND